jgi:predicted nuclease with TOPRIM domain
MTITQEKIDNLLTKVKVSLAKEDYEPEVKKQIKQLKTEKAQLLELTKRQMDSVIFYKNAADNLSGVIDSSKTVTIYIKSETNEEVNNIKFAPVDSNIIKFKSDLEFYISNK